MSFATGYRGTVMGSVQTTYADQPGQALAGMLAFASDDNFLDSIFIGESNGIEAGKGVQAITADEGLGFNRPPLLAYLPDGDETAAELYGVIVFDQAMQSQADGDGDPINGWAKGRLARILRPGRSGGRIYVKAKEAVVVGSSTVNWVITVGSDAKYEVGEFAPGVLNSGTVGTTVAVSNAKWVTNAAAGELAILEFFGNVIPTVDASI
jgi:hypothetical protein